LKKKKGGKERDNYVRIKGKKKLKKKTRALFGLEGGKKTGGSSPGDFPEEGGFHGKIHPIILQKKERIPKVRRSLTLGGSSPTKTKHLSKRGGERNGTLLALVLSINSRRKEEGFLGRGGL